jgi:hypothetical protein
MAQDKKSFVAYADWKSVFDMLDFEEAGILVKHLFAYVNDEDPELEDRILKIAFEPIKQSLKRDLKKYETTKETKSNSGALGNLKRWNNDLYCSFLAKEITLEKALEVAKHRKESQKVAEIANIAVTVSDSVNDNVSVTVSDSVILLEKETKEEIKKVFISKNEIFGKELLEGQVWIETVSMQNRITPEEVPKWIDDFNKKLITEIDTKISKKEYASHFSRWLPGEIIKAKKETQPNSGKPKFSINQ